MARHLNLGVVPGGESGKTRTISTEVVAEEELEVPHWTTTREVVEVECKCQSQARPRRMLAGVGLVGFLIFLKVP